MSTPQQGKRQRATDQGPSSHDTLQRKSTTEQNRRSVAQSQCAADGRGEQDENALPSVINADLLGKFLTDNTADMDTLLSFIEWLFSFSDEKIKRCLVSMFTGMANAISLFSSMKDEVKALNQGILAMKGQAEDYKEQLLYIEITTTQKFEVIIAQHHPVACHDTATPDCASHSLNRDCAGSDQKAHRELRRLAHRECQAGG